MITSVALIATESKTPLLASFVREHRALFARYPLVSPQDCGERLQQDTPHDIELVLPIQRGGLSQIAARVAIGEIRGVVVFRDQQIPASLAPHYEVLLQLCELHNVILATNRNTAQALVYALRDVPIAHLIFNPVSGQGNAQQEINLIRELLRPYYQVIIHRTSLDYHAQDLAMRALNLSPDLIIASGGDGTVSEVASVLIDTKIPLGIIPRGTANAFAMALGIPTNIREACSTINLGKVKIVDAARCNGHLPMVLLAGIGFEAVTVEKANREQKNRWGALAYIMAGWQQLNEFETFKAEIEIDGQIQTLETVAITIANAAPNTSVLAQGGGKVLIDDGELDVTITVPDGKFDRFQAMQTVLDLFGAGLMNAPSEREEVIHLRTSKIKVSTDPPQKVVVDGDLIEDREITIECVPNSLRIMVP
ncbi:MAG: YegS/Rv2252/BmrU family lipid kinase [Cyanobacteria bacterium P01_H01_bin.15]